MTEEEKTEKVVSLMCELKKEHISGKTILGTTECPACGGRARYRVAGSNGHVWIRCEAPNCLTVLE